MTTFESYDDFAKELLDQDIEIRAASKENTLRRRLAVALQAARQARGMSIRELAKKIGTSISQVQRVMHEEVGGSLTLRTIVKAVDALDMDVTIHVRPRWTSDRQVAAFGSVAWCRTDDHRAAVLPQKKSDTKAASQKPISGEWIQGTDEASPLLEAAIS